MPGQILKVILQTKDLQKKLQFWYTVVRHVKIKALAQRFFWLSAIPY